MEKNIKTEGQLLAMHYAIAFLLSREAIHSKTSLDAIHSALVVDMTAKFESVTDHQKEALLLGEATRSELDALFGHAEILRRATPDK